MMALRAIASQENFDPAALAYIAAASPSFSAVEKGIVNEAFKALRAAGFLEQLDRLSIFKKNKHSQAGLLDWLNPSISLTVTSPASYDRDHGVCGDSSAGYVDTAFDPSSHGVNYTVNNCSVGVLIDTSPSVASSEHIFGVSDHLSKSTRMVFSSTGSVSISVNSASSNSTPVTGHNSPGHFVISRDGSSNIFLHKDGTDLGITGAAVATANPQDNIYLCARNNIGVAAGFSEVKLAAWWAGSLLSPSEQNTLKTIIETFIANMP